MPINIWNHKRVTMETNRNYITIQRWMPKLGLTGNKLIVFALIYGFSQDGESEFYGSLAYIADCVGITKRAVLDIVNELVKNGFIVKTQKTINGVKMCSYKVPNTKTENFAGGEKSSSDEPGKNLPPTYNNTLNSDNIPPYNPPQGEQLREHFKDLWNNKLIVFYKQCYPHNVQLQKITRASLKHLPARDKELKSLVKELIADGVITAEDVGDDVWRWAFNQIWERIQRSSFLRGTARGYEGFVPNAEFILEPSKFIKIVTPIAISKYGLDDKR